MEKLVYVIWDRPSTPGEKLRERCLEELVPALRSHGAARIGVHLDDDLAPIEGPAPCGPLELPYRAVVSFWLDDHRDRASVDAAVRSIGVRSSGYLVTESTAPGDVVPVDSPPHDHREDSGRGERSPGISTVALVRRNPTLDPVTFREFWYGHQSPMSGEVQPRLHYVRNTVVHPVTPGAPPYDGIVLECWPSPEVVADPIEFHGGPEVGEENLRVMLDSVSQIFDMTSLRSLAMSEYLYG